jgi:hypothetical protein
MKNPPENGAGTSRNHTRTQFTTKYADDPLHAASSAIAGKWSKRQEPCQADFGPKTTAQHRQQQTADMENPCCLRVHLWLCQSAATPEIADG